MTQPVTQEELSALLDDALPPGRAAEVEARLAEDPALRAEYEALARTVALYRGTPLPEPPPGPPLLLPARDTDGARGPASERADTRSDEAPSGRRGWWAGLAAAAAVALALGGLLANQGGVPGARIGELTLESSTGQGLADGAEESAADMAAEAADDAFNGAAGDRIAEQALSSAAELDTQAPPSVAQLEAEPGRGGDAPALDGAVEGAEAAEVAEEAPVDEDASVPSEPELASDSMADLEADSEADARAEVDEARDVAQAPAAAEVVPVTVGPPEPDLAETLNEMVAADEGAATISPALGLLVALALAALGIGALAWATARRRAG